MLLAERRPGRHVARSSPTSTPPTRRPTTGAPTTAQIDGAGRARLEGPADASRARCRGGRRTARRTTSRGPKPEGVPRVRHRRRRATSATQVARWSIWNEPNQPQFLLPQYSAAAHAAVAADLPQPLPRRPTRGLARRRPPNAHGAHRRDARRAAPARSCAPLDVPARRCCAWTRSYRKQRLAAASCTPTATPTTPTRRAPGRCFKPEQPNDVTIGVLGAPRPRALDRAAKARRDARATCRST